MHVIKAIYLLPLLLLLVSWGIEKVGTSMESLGSTKP